MPRSTLAPPPAGPSLSTPGGLERLDDLLNQFQRSESTRQLLTAALQAVRQGMGADAAFYLPDDPAEPAEADGLPHTPHQAWGRLVAAALDRTPGSRRYVLFASPFDPIAVPSLPPVHAAALVRLSASRPIWLGAVRLTPAPPLAPADLRFVKVAASMLQVHRRHLQVQETFKSTLLDVVRGFTATIEAKDPYTRGHSERVARVATTLGRRLHLSRKELSDLYLAGLLHDVGKIGIRDAVLGKPDRLTPEEMAHIQEHPVIGERIVTGMAQFAHLRPGVRSHHERVDGRGYPDGLRGEHIPLVARVLAVADSFDAMASSRPYRAGMPFDRIEQILRAGAGSQWDASLVNQFLGCRDEVLAITHTASADSVMAAVKDMADGCEHQSSVRIR